MPNNRSVIHFTKVEEFKAFLARNGWSIEEPRGVYEVVRARKASNFIVYHKRDRTDHLTCMYGLPARLAAQFIGEQRRARQKTAPCASANPEVR